MRLKAPPPFEPGPVGVDIDWLIFGAKWDEATAELAALIRPFLQDWLIQGVTETGVTLTAAASFVVDVPEVTEFIRTYPIKFSAAVSKSYAEQIRTAVQEGLTRGESSEQIRERIRDATGPDMTENHADLIARTESKYCMEAGKLESWKHQGVTQLIWRMSPDGCPFCAEMEGRVTDINKSYFAQGEEMWIEDQDTGKRSALKFRFREINHPPLHPNCRCVCETVEEI